MARDARRPCVGGDGRNRARFSGCALALLAFLGFLPTLSSADTSTSLGDSGGEGGGPFAGLAQSPEANLFTGAMSLSVPILIPPGRKNATPALRLVYSSADGDGPFGFGWSLPLGSIERSTKHGVPRCTGSHVDDFVLMLNGAAHELVPIGSNGYRAKIDEAYLEAVANGAANTWEVKDRAGITYRFATDASGASNPNSRLWAGADTFFFFSPSPLPAVCQLTAVWALTQIQDPNGNTIDIAYAKNGNTLYPSEILYGGNVNPPQTEHVFKVSFGAVGRTYPSTSHQRGVGETLLQLINQIEIFAKAGAGSFPSNSIRSYQLFHDEIAENGRALLREIRADLVPTQTFHYSSSAFAYEVLDPPYQPPANLGNTEGKDFLRQTNDSLATKRSVMDMNGDGMTDLVVSDNGTAAGWDVYYGSEIGFAASKSTWTLTPGVHPDHMRDANNSYPKHTNFETVDLTGDGIVDYVDATSLPWRVYPGACSASGCRFLGPIDWSAPWLYLREDRKPDYIFTIQTLIDLNGDGRLDLVRSGTSSSAPWQVYLNQGIDHVSGEGSFSASVDFSASGPIRTIQPYPPFSSTFRDHFDVNGDGLPDRLCYLDGCDPLALSMTVELNTGRQFVPFVSYPNSTPPLASSRWSVEKLTIGDQVDINGDGLPDHVTTFGGWGVRLNRGGYLESPQRGWPSGDLVIRMEGENKTTIDIFDWNGDGLLDHIDGRTATWPIRLAKPTDGSGLRPSLLVRAESGLGGVTDVRYAPSTRFDNTAGDGPDLPFVTWVVTGLRRSDGLCTPTASAIDLFNPDQNDCIDSGHEIVKTIAYEDGKFDASSREFRGFRTVTETDADGNSRVVSFSQGDFTRGKIERDESYAGAKLVRRERFVWQTYSRPPRTQVYLGEHRVVEFDPDYPGPNPDNDPNKQCIMNSNNPPEAAINPLDEWGRVTKTCTRRCDSTEGVAESCDAGVVEGQVNTVTTWADPIATSAVRERPRSVRIEYRKGGSFEPLTTKWFRYDNLGASSVGNGNVTLVRTELDTDPGTADDPSVSTVYDGRYGNVLRVTDPNGNVSESEYNNPSLFGLYPDAEEAIKDSIHRATMTWNLGAGKPMSVTDANGATTTYVYDPLGRIECEARPGDSCLPQDYRPTVEYDYHYGDETENSNELKHSFVETRTPKPPGYSGQLVARTYFDALGRQRLSTTERVIGNTTNLQTVVVGHTHYDGGGRVRKVLADYIKAADIAVDPTSSEFTRYDYTLNGNLTGDQDPLGRVYQVVPPDLNETTTKYHGIWTETFDPLGHATKVRRDEFGRVTLKELHEGSNSARLWFEYTYDGLGRLLTTKTSGDAATALTQIYDSLGRVKQRIDPDSGVWEYDYDENGNLTYQGDPEANQHVEWCYDGLNRPILRCAYDGDDDPFPNACSTNCGAAAYRESRRVYDETVGGNLGIGRLTRVLRSTDAELDEAFVYDGRGRVTKSTKRVVGIETVTEFSYDRADRMVAVKYPDGQEFVYVFYESGQLASNVLELHFNDLDYDRFGRVEKLAHSNGVQDWLTYHGASENFRLQAIQTTKMSEGTNYLRQNYHYYDTGRIAIVEDLRTAPSEVLNTASYGYDGLGRLTDVLGLDQRNETFTYDSRGNLETKSKPGVGNPTINYQDGPHHAASYHNITNMPYNDNGSRREKQLSDGSKEVYEYDSLGRLTRITFPPTSKTVDFAYDYADRRVAKTVNGGTPYRYFNRYVESANGLFTKYYYAGDRLVATREAQSSQFSEAAPGVSEHSEPWVLSPVVVYGIGAVVIVLLVVPGRGRVCVGVVVARGRAFGVAVAVIVGTSPVLLAGDCDPGGGTNPIFRHYHFDHLGSLQSVTNNTGGLVYQVRYWSYGEVRGRFNGAGNPIATNQDHRYEFTGYETEFESGLEYAGARFYDPEIAQFLSHDPRQQFASPYAYGPGDPLNGTDPSGESWEVVVALVMIVAGTALSASSRGASQRDSFGAALHAATSAASTLASGPTRGANHSTTRSAVAQRSVRAASAGLSGTSATLASSGKPLGAVRSALDSYGLAYAFNEGVAGNSAAATTSGSYAQSQEQRFEVSHPAVDQALETLAANREGLAFQDVPRSRIFISEWWAGEENFGTTKTVFGRPYAIVLNPSAITSQSELVGTVWHESVHYNHPGLVTSEALHERLIFYDLVIRSYHQAGALDRLSIPRAASGAVNLSREPDRSLVLPPRR